MKMDTKLTKPDLNKPVYEIYPKQAIRIANNRCPTCNAEMDLSKFKDSLSKKEYGISGMCQQCQDSVFG